MAIQSPTTTSREGLSPTLERNIAAIIERRRQAAKDASLEQRAAAAISRFAGSMAFVYIHVILFGGWIVANSGLFQGIPRWDPSLVILAMEASVEAIFLSTFILINQNRMAAEDDARAELNLQISLLNEHETTKLIAVVKAIADRLEVRTPVDGEIAELERDVAPGAVLDRIEETSGEA